MGTDLCIVNHGCKCKLWQHTVDKSSTSRIAESCQAKHDNHSQGYLDFPVLADEQVGRLEIPVKYGRLAHVQVQHSLGSIQGHVDPPHPVQLKLQSLRTHDSMLCHHDYPFIHYYI